MPGPAPTPEPTPPVLDPSRVYVLGTLDEERCDRDVIVDVERPDAPWFGLPCGHRLPTLRQDGQLVYLHEGALRLFVADGSGFEGYPAEPMANDLALRSAPCDRVLTFALEPDTGAHVYACGGWFRAGASYLTPSTAQFLPGAADHALTLDGASFGVARRGAPVGAASVVPGIPFHVRPHADGFRLLMRAGTLIRLYDMSLEGTLSELGDYAGASGYAVRGCRVDGEDVAFCVADHEGREVVLRLTLAGAHRVVFEAGRVRSLGLLAM